MNTLSIKIIFLILLFLSTSVFANVAKVVALVGDATIVREGKIINLSKESILLKHDEIKTSNNTKVQLLFKDNTIISIGKNSTFQIYNYLYDEKNNKFEAKFNMFKGTFKTITGKIGKKAPENFLLKTKTASIGIRGTQIVISIEDNQEKIFCTEGRIFVQKNNSNLSTSINAGQFIAVNQNTNKLEVKTIKPRDIKNINKSTSIKSNLAVDNITVKEEIPDKVDKLKSTESNEETESAESNEETKSAESNEETESAESNEETKSAESNEETKSAESNEETKSTESNEETKSTESNEETESAESNEETESAESNEETEETIENTIDDDLSELTPESYFENNNSTATYKGNFNNYGFNKGKQYLKNFKNRKVKIPTDTIINMDIDFEKTSNQISNGKIKISDVGDSTSRTLTFDGNINTSKSTFDLSPTGKTKGSGGSGEIYGSEADLIKGEVNMSSSDNIQIKGNFDAEKQ